VCRNAVGYVRRSLLRATKWPGSVFAGHESDTQYIKVANYWNANFKRHFNFKVLSFSFSTKHPLFRGTAMATLGLALDCTELAFPVTVVAILHFIGRRANPFESCLSAAYQPECHYTQSVSSFRNSVKVQAEIHCCKTCSHVLYFCRCV